MAFDSGRDAVIERRLKEEEREAARATRVPVDAARRRAGLPPMVDVRPDWMRPRGIGLPGGLPNDPTATVAPSQGSYQRFQAGIPEIPGGPGVTPSIHAPGANPGGSLKPRPGTPRGLYEPGGAVQPIANSVEHAPPKPADIPVPKAPPEASPDTAPSRADLIQRDGHKPAPASKLHKPPQLPGQPDYETDWDSITTAPPAAPAKEPDQQLEEVPEEGPFPLRISNAHVNPETGIRPGGVIHPDVDKYEAAKEANDMVALGESFGIRREDYEDAIDFGHAVMKADRDWQTRSKSWSAQELGDGEYMWQLNDEGRAREEARKGDSFVRRMHERYAHMGISHDDLRSVYDYAEGDHLDKVRAVRAAHLNQARSDDLASRKEAVRQNGINMGMSQQMGVPVGHIMAANTLGNARTPMEMAQALMQLEAVYPGQGYGASALEILGNTTDENVAAAGAGGNVGVAQANAGGVVGVAQANAGGMRDIAEINTRNELTPEQQLEENERTRQSGLAATEMETNATVDAARAEADGAAAAAGQTHPQVEAAQMEIDNSPMGRWDAATESAAYEEGGFAGVSQAAIGLTAPQGGGRDAVASPFQASQSIVNFVVGHPGGRQMINSLQTGDIASIPTDWARGWINAELGLNQEGMSGRDAFEAWANKYQIPKNGETAAWFEKSAGMEAGSLTDGMFGQYYD